MDRRGPSNRFGDDYEAEAGRMPPPPCEIIDVHAHIGGPRSAEIYARAASLFGVTRVYSMTRLEAVEGVREVLGDMIRFNAVPDWSNPDRMEAMGSDFLHRIERFRELGAGIVKLFAAPRMRDAEEELGHPGALALDSPMYRDAARLASELGMAIMTHVADPDTWFKAKYTDSSRYGTKLDQYRPLERMLDAFEGPWIAAHMGGFPEDLEFLDRLLERHPNLHLDTSACKWMLRELGGQDTAAFNQFMTKWSGRILFGSDIVTMDDHLGESEGNELAMKASGADQAFDLYASRYWTLRRLFEQTGRFESPIVDPDLHMVDPDRHPEDAAPEVTCHGLDRGLLGTLYRGAAESFFSTR